MSSHTDTQSHIYVCTHSKKCIAKSHNKYAESQQRETRTTERYSREKHQRDTADKESARSERQAEIKRTLSSPGVRVYTSPSGRRRPAPQLLYTTKGKGNGIQISKIGDEEQQVKEKSPTSPYNIGTNNSRNKTKRKLSVMSRSNRTITPLPFWQIFAGAPLNFPYFCLA